MAYKYKQAKKTTIKLNTGYKGESIEEKIRRIVNNGEAIKDGAPLIYTDRADGVQAGYNIRTDRFEVAVEAMDKVSKDRQAKREAKAKVVKMEKEKSEGKKPDAGGEPTQGTNS